MGKVTRKLSQIVEVRPAGPDHQVVSVQGGYAGYRRKVCSDCPWRKDKVGEFPPEAFVISASTSYDTSTTTFACHQSGTDKTCVCAGFLLRGADNNIAVRMGYITGKYQDNVHDGGHELHDSYRDMAVANGVDPNDPALKRCR